MGHMDQPPTPAETLRHRLAYFRSKREWSQLEVAERMTAYGLPWVRTTVAKVEAGTRDVSVNELVGLAFVLGIPPITLMVPPSAPTMRVTPNTTTGTTTAWWWMVGEAWQGGTFPGEVIKYGSDGTTPLERFYREAAPDFLVTADDRLPGLRELRRGVAVIQQMAGCAEEHVPAIFPDIESHLTELHAQSGHMLDRWRATVKRVKNRKHGEL
jgi:hypothetical protein